MGLRDLERRDLITIGAASAFSASVVSIFNIEINEINIGGDGARPRLETDTQRDFEAQHETDNHSPTSTESTDGFDTTESTPSSGSTLYSYNIKVRFKDEIHDPNSIENEENWHRESAKRLYTWDRYLKDNLSTGLPTTTSERTDYSKDYYDNIGGNFIIQQAGAYGSFQSVFQFSEYPQKYTRAPFKPSLFEIRVGGTSKKDQWRGDGKIILMDSNTEEIIRFSFPFLTGGGGLEINGSEVEQDRNNGLYLVRVSEINWENETFDIDVYKQTSTGYENHPTFSSSSMNFHSSDASDFDGIFMHSRGSGYVYMDGLIL